MRQLQDGAAAGISVQAAQRRKELDFKKHKWSLWTLTAVFTVAALTLPYFALLNLGFAQLSGLIPELTKTAFFISGGIFLLALFMRQIAKSLGREKPKTTNNFRTDIPENLKRIFENLKEKSGIDATLKYTYEMDEPIITADVKAGIIRVDQGLLNELQEKTDDPNAALEFLLAGKLARIDQEKARSFFEGLAVPVLSAYALLAASFIATSVMSLPLPAVAFMPILNFVWSLAGVLIPPLSLFLMQGGFSSLYERLMDVRADRRAVRMTGNYDAAKQAIDILPREAIDPQIRGSSSTSLVYSILTAVFSFGLLSKIKTPSKEARKRNLKEEHESMPDLVAAPA